MGGSYRPHFTHQIGKDSMRRQEGPEGKGNGSTPMEARTSQTSRRVVPVEIDGDHCHDITTINQPREYRAGIFQAQAQPTLDHETLHRPRNASLRPRGCRVLGQGLQPRPLPRPHACSATDQGPMGYCVRYCTYIRSHARACGSPSFLISVDHPRSHGFSSLPSPFVTALFFVVPYLDAVVVALGLPGPRQQTATTTTTTMTTRSFLKE